MNELPPNMANDMLYEAAEELERMETDPKHPFFGNPAAIKQYRIAYETDMALRGQTPHQDITPQERAIDRIESQFPTELEDGMIDLINTSLHDMVAGEISAGEMKRINENGEAIDLDDAAYDALVDSKLAAIPQDRYNRERAEMAKTLRLPDGTTGEDAYARLYAPAKLAYDRSGQPAALWAAVTMNKAALSAYAALGSSMQRRDQAIARVNQSTGQPGSRPPGWSPFDWSRGT